MTLDELAAATKDLQSIENEILDALRQMRLADYAELSQRLRDARERYDELADSHFQTLT